MSDQRGRRRCKLTDQSFVLHPDRTASPCDGHLGFRNRLRGGSTARTPITRRWNLLSQVTVRRIRQLGLEMYVVTRSLTRLMSDEFPPWLTLTINPVRIKPTLKRGDHRVPRKIRTREITEREVGQIRTAEFEADAILRKAELASAVRIPVQSR